MIRVLIADDHAIVREGLKQIVADTTDVVVAGEAANGHEVLDYIRAGRVRRGPAGHRHAGQGRTGHAQGTQGGQAAPAGADPEHVPGGAVRGPVAEGRRLRLPDQGERPGRTGRGDRKVSKKGKYISASLGEKLAFLLDSGGEQPPHERLSDREYQVMLMIAGGKTATEVAEEMCLSVKTISTYRARALRKMGMRNNAEFTFYAMKEGLLG